LTYKRGLSYGLISGIILWLIIFRQDLISTAPEVIELALFIASISTIFTVAILLRPLLRGKSFSTMWEGIATGVVGTFDVIGVIVAFASGTIPVPT
jgi:hypothetical protein